MADNNLALHVTPTGIPWFALDVKAAFGALTPQQKQYAHFMNTAGWHGTGIVAAQLSPESLPLLQWLFRVFNTTSTTSFREAVAAAGIDDATLAAVLEYTALVISNMGNYLSFGDSKFIPSVARETFVRVVDAGLAQRGDKDEVLRQLHDGLLDRMYDTTPSQLVLGYPPKGISTYYSSNIAESDAVVANAFLDSKGISGYNTRVFKDADGTLRIRIASSVSTKASEATVFEGRTIVIEYGDHSEYLARVAAALDRAKEFAENDNQRKMITSYVKHFTAGDINDHKESQKHWVADKGPVVETNIGFIESYRDPSGVRGEWEGFVAVVDKDQSLKFDALVQNGESFITRLPWGQAFEKDTFHRPDFTSLKVLAFASSGIPAGICIPNYDDIRQDFGFKNVYLDNVVGAINFKDKLTHLTDADWDIYKAGFISAMSVNVGVHELLGHGTGKLFVENSDGTFNFDRNIVNPFTGKPVATWYRNGETWSSKFGGLSNAYEECRAEAVALYLGLERDLLQIFDLTTAESQDATVHVLWLNMLRAGVVGLEFYSPDLKQWRQAHMRARFCILQKLLRAANSIVTIRHTHLEDLTIEIDASRIRTDGRAAIGELLRELNINKAIADVVEGTRFFTALTEVDEEFVKVRETVMKFKKPRKQFVQPHTRISESGEVELLEFSASAAGAIDALVARHRDIPL